MLQIKRTDKDVTNEIVTTDIISLSILNTQTGTINLSYNSNVTGSRSKFKLRNIVVSPVSSSVTLRSLVALDDTNFYLLETDTYTPGSPMAIVRHFNEFLEFKYPVRIEIVNNTGSTLNIKVQLNIVSG